jgi:hydrogenase expression/formation protein HypE
MKIRIKNSTITLSHGAGGRAMSELIDQLFIKYFNNPYLAAKNDQARFFVDGGNMVMTTDSYVISPLFFPGGNIGSLSVHGTINDIAMSGAKPLYMSTSFIIEEGFPLRDLQRIVQSMAIAAQQAGVLIVTGDTKVVERGKGDGVFITTTAIGMVPKGIEISAHRAQVGDHVLVSGYIGDHGIAVMSQRENLQFSAPVISDTCALHDLVADMIKVVPDLHCLRDPTRGGLGTVLNEWTQQSQVGFLIDEALIPIRPAVAGACELLGLDPLYIANEGKLAAVCSASDSERLLSVMRAHPLGREAAIIGKVTAGPPYYVQMQTSLGGVRLVDWLTGEQLPRIC